MSAKVSAWVWHESRAKGTDFLVMLAHADESNDTGRVSASVRNLARKARCDDRTLQRARERLVDLGELREAENDRGPGGTKVYRVLMTGVPQVVPDQPTAAVHAIGGGTVPPGGTLPPVADDHPRQAATGQTTPEVDRSGGGAAPGVAESHPSSTSNAVESPSSVAREAAAKRGARLPEDWKPSPRLVAWQRAKGIPDDLARRETENFVDYWLAKSGKDASKVDWDRTWQKWMRTAHTEAGSGRRQPVDWAAERQAQRDDQNGWMSA